ncbi:MAG: peptide deformylase [Candidatus Doudnabacteria bacterium RIFCSPHIGHO2_02_FULL_46_11]|uniref:Peptide deformylase n=1 Tax=Candidatus Doudnabacteria bacterium RIFCSPHIGHO2_02_FULL_46_11 TaxID=1817832 RepID=A0A1F5P9I4_9BACT|nr:MAG: peptide deformylase [Candidatus Doudnabacteria bacterium RIFCSPHIGHO2_02_FULL_46_11]
MSNNKHQLKLVTLPAENLREPSEKVKFPLSRDFQRLLAEMLRICRKSKGVGIAAPQVGVNLQVVIINLEHLKVPPFPLINPKIQKYSAKKLLLEEGCLSVPGKFAKVERAEKVDVVAYDPKGKKLEFKADGFLAHVIQHEVDHINGMLFVDRLSKAERDELTKEFYG